MLCLGVGGFGCFPDDGLGLAVGLGCLVVSLRLGFFDCCDMVLCLWGVALALRFVCFVVNCAWFWGLLRLLVWLRSCWFYVPVCS